jgi:hypothetical protein
MFTPSTTNPTDPAVTKIADALDLARYLAQRGITVVGCIVSEHDGQLLMKFRAESIQAAPQHIQDADGAELW